MSRICIAGMLIALCSVSACNLQHLTSTEDDMPVAETVPDTARVVADTTGSGYMGECKDHPGELVRVAFGGARKLPCEPK